MKQRTLSNTIPAEATEEGIRRGVARGTRVVWLGALGVAAALIASAATAADVNGPGWYGGLSLDASSLGVHSGDIDQALSNQGIAGSSTIDHHDTSMGLQLGYRLTPNFAVEGGYTDLGRYDFNSSVAAPADTLNGNWKAHAWSLSGVGTLPLADRWSAFGRLGVTRTDATFNASSQTGANAPNGTSHTGTGLVFGGGANYDISRQWYGRAEIDHYTDVGDSNSGKGDVDVLSLGVGYKF
jgi:OOP family OmpA-OmpF porin